MAKYFTKKTNLCRRKKKTLILLSLVVGTFCFMQLLSLLRLNIFRQRQTDSVLPDYGANRDADAQRENVHDIDTNFEKTKVKMYKDAQIDNDAVHNGIQHLNMPRGVHANSAHHYAAKKQNIFHCITSKKAIPMDQVNDDYCDCDDSSDEPGTSACPNSRFYCKYQLLHEDAQFVAGSRVNDGICDCCDGSDEWNGRHVPNIMQLSESSQKMTIHQSPCSDRCSREIQRHGEEENFRKEGIKLRLDYLKAAEDLSPNMKQKYGPHGVFYKLANTCLQHKTSEYEYTVCPFSSVKQQKFPQPSVMLGRTPHWEMTTTTMTGDFVLLMSDGDAKLCPQGQARKTKIYFFCGLEDAVTNVKEMERCLYTVSFRTPAACT